MSSVRGLFVHDPGSCKRREDLEDKTNGVILLLSNAVANTVAIANA